MLRAPAYHLAKAGSESRIILLNRMLALAKDEFARTQDSLETARRDSRMGYEWEEDYIYTPEIIEKKIEVLRSVFAASTDG